MIFAIKIFFHTHNYCFDPQVGDLGRRGWGDLSGSNTTDQSYYNSQGNYQDASDQDSTGSYQSNADFRKYSGEKSSLVTGPNQK